MRDLTADKGNILHAGQADVSNKHGNASKMAGILLAQEAPPDPAGGIMRCIIAHSAKAPVLGSDADPSETSVQFIVWCR